MSKSFCVPTRYLDVFVTLNTQGGFAVPVSLPPIKLVL